MFIYTDAGQTRQFTYFIFTNEDGKILGYKLDVTKSDTDLPEESAVVAAAYWARHFCLGATIVTDKKDVMKTLYGTYGKKTGRMRQTRKALNKLLYKTGINITWLPRERNIAGKILETMLTLKPLSAEKILTYFQSLKRV